MYAYVGVILALSGLTLVNSGNLQSMDDVSYKRVPQILSHANTTVVKGNRELSQQPDRCGAVAFKCYEPILSYMDSDGEFCGWKDMTSFSALPQICTAMGRFSSEIWGGNAVKNRQKFIKTCDKRQTFQKCVKNNQVCRRDYEIGLLMSVQNRFCDNLQAILSVMTCRNGWDSSVTWNKLLYTHSRIVQVCPATHYRQLALNTMKLSLFTYITYPSSRIDGVVESVNAEAAGRYICQSMQEDLCVYKRADKVCPGYLPMYVFQNYNDQRLMVSCRQYAFNVGECDALVNYVNMMCPIHLTSDELTVKTDFADLRKVYNVTYWHYVSNSEVDILLHTDNKGIGHCDAGNLLFKQIGCFHQYMTLIDINHANNSDYLTEYMCSGIKLYNSCFDAYIVSSCPDEANIFKGIGSFLHAQCNIFKEADTNVNCPLYGVYSHMMSDADSWFQPISILMRQYITVIKYNQMTSAPFGWKESISRIADKYITYYKSWLNKGEKRSSVKNVIISTVCDPKAAAVYDDFVTLSTGEQFHQLMNHVIKAYAYIKLLVQ